MVPLVEPHDAPRPSTHGLNPTLMVGGTPYVMLTQFSGAVPIRDLGQRVATLADEDHRIVGAIDALISTA